MFDWGKIFMSLAVVLAMSGPLLTIAFIDPRWLIASLLGLMMEFLVLIWDD